ncbi:hypothetical protein DFJ73DRAFT_907428 [Zopfochytrium polystomum]|nr:hypothetical protein DFJ73DRAFT_907428 [Zopfochytrium polystomum]
MALYKARMHWPIMIITQMRFQSHSMLQMYLVATVSGMFGFVLVEALGLYKRAPKPPLSLGVESLGRFGANILGGSMIGTGMALAGACPGTLILQTSTGIPSAIPAISGAAVASVSYGYLVQAIRSVIPNYGAKSPAITIDGLIAQSSSTKPATEKAAAGAAAQKPLHHTFAFSAALVSALIIPFIAALHRYKPYDADVAAHLNITTTGGSPTTAVVRIDGFPPHPSAPLWSAIGAGLVIGATQLASLLLLGRADRRVVAKRLDRRWYANAPFFKDYVNDHENAFFVAGMVAGAAAAAAAAGGGSVLAAAAAVQHPRRRGGAAELAQLSVASFVSVAAMFAAAMGLSAVIY